MKITTKGKKGTIAVATVSATLGTAAGTMLTPRVEQMPSSLLALAQERMQEEFRATAAAGVDLCGCGFRAKYTHNVLVLFCPDHPTARLCPVGPNKPPFTGLYECPEECGAPGDGDLWDYREGQLTRRNP